MKLEHLLLGLISMRPLTGYDIKKYLDQHGRFLRSRTTMSQVYRSLSAMEERGWATHDVDHRPGAQDAKVYRSTPEGHTVLLDWLTGPYVPPSRFQDPEFAARLSFAGFMTRDQLLVLVETELNARVEQVATFRDRDRTVRLDPSLEIDAELQRAISVRLHHMGMEAVDLHIAQLRALHDDILDGRFPDAAAAASAPFTVASATDAVNAHTTEEVR